MSSRVRLEALLVLGVLAGCYLPVEATDAGTSPDAGLSGVDAGTTSSDGGASGDGLPCELEAMVARSCRGCHRAGGTAPMPLDSRADFLAAARSNAGVTVAQQSLTRMQSTTAPMPPTGAQPADVQLMADWVNAGMPSGSCAPADAGVDAGVEPVDAGPEQDAGAGLPCDVDAVIANGCRSCHRAGGTAPMPLMSRGHFLAATPSNPAVTVGAQSIARMRNVTAPMPPSGQLPNAEIQAVEAWVNAGMPVGVCDSPDAGSDPFAHPPQCTSNTTWTQGNSESPRMNPGRACIACHRPVNVDEGEEKAPEGIAGTVYPTAHEPDLCNGLPAGAVVVIRGSNGQEFRLNVNAVGNFYMYSNNALVRPYTARVEYQGRTRAMGTPQMSGDCNSCHTQAGTNGAPGRVLAP